LIPVTEFNLTFYGDAAAGKQELKIRNNFTVRNFLLIDVKDPPNIKTLEFKIQNLQQSCTVKRTEF